MAGPTVVINTPDLAEFTVRSPSLEFTGTYGGDISYDITIADTSHETVSGGPIEAIGGHIAFFNNLFITSLKTNNGINYSGDGKQWTQASGIYPVGASTMNHSIEVGGILYIATTSGIYSTSDGMSMTRVSTFNVAQIAYGSGMFVAAPSAGSTVITSQDGVTWTSRLRGGTGTGSIVFHDGNFISFSRDGNAYTSADGITWSSSALPLGSLSADPSAIAYNGEVILALRLGYPSNSVNFYRASGSPLSYTPITLSVGSPQFGSPAQMDDALLLSTNTGTRCSYDGGRTFATNYIGLTTGYNVASYVGAIGNGLRVAKLSTNSLAVQEYVRTSSDSSLKFENTVNDLDTDPFTSGEKVSFTPDPLSKYGTYKYVVRGKGVGEEWGDYAVSRQFSVNRPPNTGVFMQFLT